MMMMKRNAILSTCTLFLWVLFYLLTLAGEGDGSKIIKTTTQISRSDFPQDFVFGAGTSAYQAEGGFAEDGRGPSIWDTFTHAGKTVDGSTGDIAADQYHKYKEDVKLMHDMGLDAYRFSISWSRLIPGGRGAINPGGLNYYNNLIDELLKYGIEAHVTLSHFDIPQALQDEYGGFLSSNFIEDFAAYADVCFKEFGDRVKNWVTFNEPNIQTVASLDMGIIPPGRCSYPFGVGCSEGNSTTEPYLAAHIFLLSHAAAVNVYWKKFQEKQEGLIGITLIAFWFEPITESAKDVAARQRALDFFFGWFMDPLIYGNYPASMRNIVGSRLPSFTENDLKQLKGSFDFIGLTHYYVMYVQDSPRILDKYGSDYIRDVSIGIPYEGALHKMDFTKLKSNGMAMTPWGLQKLLEYVKLKYGNPMVVIHENGLSTTGDDSSDPIARNDTERTEYLRSYIESLLLSVRNGSNTKGYFVWAFMDCFEVMTGYNLHFGLYGVDFNDKDRKRYARQSAHWYSTFLGKSGRKTETSTYLYNES